MRQIVLDTETTGLSPKDGHRIIEIGCLELVNRRLSGKKLHFYLNPERDIEQEAVAVHGITTEFLKDKPRFGEIADKLLDFLTGTELIIHNAPFDVGFLNAEFKKLNHSCKAIAEYCGIIDTLVIARKKHPGQQVSLDALCRRYGVDNTNRDLHGALLDAGLLAKVYLLMTGGQGAFAFGERDSTMAAPREGGRTKSVVADCKSSRIIRATAEELSAHEQMLQKIREESGACLWEAS